MDKFYQEFQDLCNKHGIYATVTNISRLAPDCELVVNWNKETGDTVYTLKKIPEAKAVEGLSYQGRQVYRIENRLFLIVTLPNDKTIRAKLEYSRCFFEDITSEILAS